MDYETTYFLPLLHFSQEKIWRNLKLQLIVKDNEMIS